MIAALNGVDILACDLQNACLNAPCAEKTWFEGGIECGEDCGKVLIVTRALHSLKLAGFSWQSSFAQSLRDLEFQLTKADPDAWIQAAVHDDSFKHCEMAFVHVDDLLLVSHQPRKVLELIAELHTVEPGSDKAPEIYLGMNIKKIQTPDGHEIWAQSPKTCIKNVICTVKDLSQEDGKGCTLKNNAKNPLPVNCRPELDITKELGPELLSCHLQLIGICHWAIKLRCIDVLHEVSLLSQHQANLREGHLKALHHVFACLKKHPDMGRIAFDPKSPEVDESVFCNNAIGKSFMGTSKKRLTQRHPNQEETW